MTGSAQYTPEEEKAIREAFKKSGAANCPGCGTLLASRAIGGGSFGLGYARKRTWLLCGTCKRSVIFDADRGTRT